ncbi:hypothetical protein G4228_014944 [Cervus hanglu yarkandensis]|nr:hypothetical protein G4228_014944 [Cervus hanglu yarkandensis]
MSEEVTYATLKFSNPKTKEPQESHSLKRTDSHETPDLELGGEAETGAGSVMGTAEATETRAVRGHSAPSKVWYPIAFVSLLLNLVVLAGLGALGLMYYYKLIFNSKTVYDVQLNVTEHVGTTALPTDMPTTVSGEHIIESLMPYLGPSCYWIGLKMDSTSKLWIWTNGDVFSNWFEISGNGPFAFLNSDGVHSSRGFVDIKWICSKPISKTE